MRRLLWRFRRRDEQYVDLVGVAMAKSIDGQVVLV